MPADLNHPSGHPSVGFGETPPRPTRGDNNQQSPPGFALPTISLPKGGGAIRGIDEKFAVGAATGTATLSIPVFTSPGRAGFAPQLSLSYDSGAGNGPYGFGWTVPVPGITRKTSKGIPRYRDDEPDTFVLAGGEDLVPAAKATPDGWINDTYQATAAGGSYTVQRYRPRVDAAFTRIERWQNDYSGDSHWKTVSRDNVASLYGQSTDARIADPDNASHVFTWLLETSYDDRGNMVAYDYKAEDDANVPRAPHERNRVVTANRYPKRIRYGNRMPYHPANGNELPSDWCFHITFDYGEHDPDAPSTVEETTWPCRPDPFSTYRSGFEIRTFRTCQRILVFHQFVAELGTPQPVLVRSTDMTYTGDGGTNPDSHGYTLLRSVTQTGYVRNQPGGYSTKKLPAVDLGYSQANIDDTIRTADSASLENLPEGLGGTRNHWVDLDGEGLPGILAEHAGACYYKRNQSAWSPSGPPEPRFAPLELVATQPSSQAAPGSRQLVDLGGDGRLCLAQYAPPEAGFSERDGQGGWLPFRLFDSALNIDWSNPNLRLVDLDGDGLADVLITSDEVLTWYPSLAHDGFGLPETVRKPFDDENGPALVFADGTESIFLADFSGDGLSDLVRIRNGDVCYWPNLGYGRFGPKITMDRPPRFDHPDLFDQKRLRLADVDGSGTADLLYLGRDSASVCFNQSGNSWSAIRSLPQSPPTDNPTMVTVVDLLGTGTTCLVWSSPLPADTAPPLCYLDLMGGQKPHLMTSVTNNLGAETRIRYAPSTRYYLQDQAAGTPWITRLPFPVHVVDQVETFEHISGTKLVTTYSYHHGYFDGLEREFRGFARVEQSDTESFPRFSGTGLFSSTPTVAGEEFHLPAVRTRTWSHTGAYLTTDPLSNQLSDEYYRLDAAASHLADTVMPAELTPNDLREAERSLRGRIIRQEIYADDKTDASSHPFRTTEHRHQVQLVQPTLDNTHPCFSVHDSETLSYHYERDPTDPRVDHDLVLALDRYGTVTKSANVGYPRRNPAYAEQATTLLTYVEHDTTNADDRPDWYRIAIPIETRSYQLTGLTPTPAPLFNATELLTAAMTMPEIPFEGAATGTTPQKRAITTTRAVYLADDLNTPLPIGHIDSLALLDRTYELTMTPELIAHAYPARTSPAAITEAVLGDGGYVDLDTDGSWWAPSSHAFYSPNPASPDPAYAARHFYLPQGAIDPFGSVTTVGWENDLVVVTTTDAVGNKTSATVNYRTLQPWLTTDTNDNRIGIRFDELGLVTARASMGKAADNGTDEGDHLDLGTDETSASDDPTSRFNYDLHAYATWADDPTRDPAHPAPSWAHSRARVRHKDPDTPWVETYIYTDGLGRVALTKIQAEPGDAPVRGSDARLERDLSGNINVAATQSRWLGTGRVVYDNKANPIKAYEPYFDSTPAYTDEADLTQFGVTAITRYDPLSRPIRVDKPDGTYRSVEFGPWRQLAFDENDNVLRSAWYTARRAGEMGPDQQDAAAKAAVHANTPTVSALDPLGRTFHTTADGVGGQFQTSTMLDIQGRALTTTDALQRVTLTTTYDIGGRTIGTSSIDAGQRWLFPNAAGRPFLAWDGRDYQLRHTYDPSRRPLGVYVSPVGGRETLVEHAVYGEGQLNEAENNLRGSLYKQHDSAGIATTVRRDFKGNVVTASRQLLANPTADANWSSPSDLGPNFTATTIYDALNRVVTSTTPDGSITSPSFNERSLLQSLTVSLLNGPPTPYVTATTYDPNGQRRSINYGNGAATGYTYDPDTFRLIHLVTTRSGVGNNIQDLAYTYDPTGNITRVRDDAQSTVFFSNQLVSPVSDYTYDTIYRLVSATGREHISQNANAAVIWSDIVRHTWPLPTDAQAMQNYTDTFTYDLPGNITTVAHAAAVGPWTRRYTYAEANHIGTNNRLAMTHVADTTEPYSYDPNGNMTSMPHLSLMTWDFANRLRSTAQQVVGDGNPETCWYNYGASGQRVRKATVNGRGRIIRERIYLGGYEVTREYTSSGELTLERQILIVADSGKNVAVIETTTIDTSAPTASRPAAIRYQFSDHLGSSCVELDESAGIISYEEYYPFGATSFLAGRSAAEVSLKRYRYTGHEHDIESGLHYHGARYYAPWIGRWTSCDQMGLVDGTSLYIYARNEPTNRVDNSGNQATSWDPLVQFRQLQKAVTELAAPVLNSAPVQYVSGQIEAVQEIPEAVVTGAIDRGARTVAEIKAHPDYLDLGPMGIVAAATVATVRQEAKEIQIKTADQGGGAKGLFVAANQQWNPAFGILEHGDRTIQAARRGDWHAAGKESVKTGVAIVDTVTVATGIAEGASAITKGRARIAGAPVPAEPAVPPDIVTVELEGNAYHFDLTNERLVGVDGISGSNTGPRPDYRIGKSGRADRPSFIERGIQQPDGTWEIQSFDNRPRLGEAVDQGHAVAFRSGGGSDINLFPQNAELNQGKGLGDKAWRTGERTLQKYPGTSFWLMFHY